MAKYYKVTEKTTEKTIKKRKRNYSIPSTQTLLNFLKRKSYRKPGILARLLLTALADKEKVVVSEHWSKELGLNPKEFTPLRVKLRADELLEWDENVKRCRYLPGPKLIKYLNKYLIETTVLATENEIKVLSYHQDVTNNEVSLLKRTIEDHSKRLKKVEDISNKLLAVVGPPDTIPRRKARSKLAEDLKNTLV